MRKKEKVIYYFSNKNQSDVNAAKGDEGYYFLVDTKNKELVLHTANNDGEASAYDLVINTEEGIVTLVDVQGNYFELRSPEGKLNVHINQDITITHNNNMSVTTGGNRDVHTSGNTTETAGGVFTIKAPLVQIN